MSWIENAPGLFERPLGSTEAGMAAILAGPSPPAREYILITCVVGFKAHHLGHEVFPAVRQAWKALRLLKSPDIATTFGEGKKFYQVPTPADVETWLDDTFAIATSQSTVKQAVRDRQARPTYLPTCTLIPNKGQHEAFEGSIVLFISHWRTEAGGVLKIINQILDFAEDLLNRDSATEKALADHIDGSEVKLLTPTLDEIFMPDTSPSTDAEARVAKDFREYYSKFPPLDFPLQGSLDAKPSCLKVEQRTYTSISTSSLISACKSASISVTAAVHAAYLSAVWELADESSKTRNYASIMPASTRIRSPYRDQGCWDSARFLLLHAPPGQDLITRARHLKKQYSRAVTQEWLYDDIKQIPVEMAKPLSEGVSPAPTSFPWFTSIGVLDNEVIRSEHGSITIEDVTFWADSTMPGIVLRLWTFKQSLSIQIQWNAAFYTNALIKQTLDLLEEAIGQGLDCNLAIEKSSVEEYHE